MNYGDYYVTYATDEWNKGRQPMDYDEFVSVGLPRIAKRYEKDWQEYLKALETPGIRVANMDQYELAMVMQYDFKNYRKRLIERLMEAERIRRKAETNLLKKYGTTNFRMIRAIGQEYPAPNEIGEKQQYGSVLPQLDTDMLRMLRTELTGRNSQKTPRAQAQRDVERVFNNMGVRM